MTLLEQYKKAYGTLTGRVDTLIRSLERVEKNFVVEGAAISFTVKALTSALLEAERAFVEEEPDAEK